VETDQILRKLQKHYGLKEKEVLIISALQFNKAPADEICEKTKIPVGRVYAYLNNLVSKGLIERTSKKPYIYEIHNFNRNVISFMKHSRDTLIRRETEVLKLMRGSSSEHIETLDTKEQFTQYHLNIIAEGQRIQIVCVTDSFPFLLYPSTWDKFQKQRQLVVSQRSTISFTDEETSYLVFKSYKEALQTGKKFEVIFEKAAFDRHIKILRDGFGDDYVKDFLQGIKSKVLQYGIQAHLLDEFITMQTDLNENRVGLSLRHENVTFGIVIFSKKVVQIYRTSFEQKLERTIPLMEYIDGLQ